MPDHSPEKPGVRRVSHVMSTDVKMAEAEDTVASALERMRAEKLQIIAVIDGGAVIGVLTEDDVRTRVTDAGLDAADTQLSEAMTPQVFTCSADDSMSDAMRTMERRKVHHLLVLDDSHDLVGILSREVLAAALMEQALSSGALESTIEFDE